MQIHIQCMWIVYMYECMFTFIDTCKDRKRGTNRKNTCCQGKLFPLLCLCRWAQNSKRKPSQYQLHNINWTEVERNRSTLKEEYFYVAREVFLCCKRNTISEVVLPHKKNLEPKHTVSSLLPDQVYHDNEEKKDEIVGNFTMNMVDIWWWIFHK